MLMTIGLSKEQERERERERQREKEGLEGSKLSFLFDQVTNHLDLAGQDGQVS